MNMIAFIGAAFLLVGCMAVNARTFHTGHLFVALIDRETGGPITNATVTVRCQTKFSLSHMLGSFFTRMKMERQRGCAVLFYDIMWGKIRFTFTK